MEWKKLGLIKIPFLRGSWRHSHAMIPTPMLLNSAVIRVYITFCDSSGIGRPGYVDLDANNPTNILAISDNPLLELGVPGSFDDNGVVPCSVIKIDKNVVYMYYVGFEICEKIRYRLMTGLAISDDGGNTFRKHSQVPVLDRSDGELFFRCGPHCIFEGKKFKMWYIAGSDWELVNGKQVPVYNIRYIESDDGIHWPSEGKIVLSISKEDEHGFGRPIVINNLFESRLSMFYSIRRRSLGAYRLGYAESYDGKNWVRKDESLNLNISEIGFDSNAIMYAAPFKVGEIFYTFYNGNEFGREGFGVAELESSH